jgi:endonuclease YncB( thermonuclease family)
MKIIQKYLLVLLLLFSPETIFGQKVTGKVTHIKDGDSFVLLSENKNIEVRLDGIDCPEKGQPYTSKAKQFTSNLIYDKLIVVDIKGYDKYKRALGVVYLPDKRILNEELLKAGLAWHYKKYNKETRLAQMETTARKSRKGLWDDPEPVPPWEYRQMKRQQNKHNPK